MNPMHFPHRTYLVPRLKVLKCVTLINILVENMKTECAFHSWNLPFNIHFMGWNPCLFEYSKLPLSSSVLSTHFFFFLTDKQTLLLAHVFTASFTPCCPQLRGSPAPPHPHPNTPDCTSHGAATQPTPSLTPAVPAPCHGTDPHPLHLLAMHNF